MSIERIRPFAAALALVACVYGPAHGGEDTTDGYSLLSLGETWVKWGNPELGTRAEVTYAFASGAMDFPEARNCGSLAPLGGLLKRSGVAAEAFRREVKFAFGEWSRVAGVAFRLVNDAAAADIVIGAQGRPRGRAFSNVAYSGPDHDGTRSISKSLICLNPAQKWKIGFDGDLEVYDLRYTLIHEIGHAIGLDHPGPHGQVMSFSYHEDFRNLQAGDVAGAHMLYGDADASVASRNITDKPSSQATGPAESGAQELSLGN